MPDVTKKFELDDPSNLPQHMPGFDCAVLNDLVDNDPAMFKQLTLIFISSFEAPLANIDRALAAGDRGELRAMGHRAKSTARNIGAIALGTDAKHWKTSPRWQIGKSSRVWQLGCARCLRPFASNCQCGWIHLEIAPSNSSAAKGLAMKPVIPSPRQWARCWALGLLLV